MSETVSGLPVEVTVRDEAWISDQKMGAFLSVSRGSAEPPRLLELSYRGAADTSAPLAIVGQSPCAETGTGPGANTGRDWGGYELMACISDQALVFPIINNH